MSLFVTVERLFRKPEVNTSAAYHTRPPAWLAQTYLEKRTNQVTPKTANPQYIVVRLGYDIIMVCTTLFFIAYESERHYCCETVKEISATVRNTTVDDCSLTWTKSVIC